MDTKKLNLTKERLTARVVLFGQRYIWAFAYRKNRNYKAVRC